MNRLVMILALTVASGAGASGYFWKQAQHERSRADRLQAQLAELERHQSQPTNPFSSLAGIPAAITEEPAPAAARQRAPAAAIQSPAITRMQGAANVRDFRERFLQQQRLLMEDPEYREARRVQQRMMLDQAYPDLAEALGIGPDQMNRFLDLLAEQQMKSQVTESFDGNDPGQIEQWQRKFQERERSNQAAIADLLGTDGLQRWKDYQASLGARYRARQLSSALESSGTPLRQDQLQSLQQALLQGNERVRNPWPTAGERFQANGRLPAASDRIKLQEQQLQQTVANNEQLRAALANVLSDEQLAAIQQIHDRELQMQQAQLRIQRAQMQAQERSGLPTEGGGAVQILAPATTFAIPD